MWVGGEVALEEGGVLHEDVAAGEDGEAVDAHASLLFVECGQTAVGCCRNMTCRMLDGVLAPWGECKTFCFHCCILSLFVQVKCCLFVH